MNFVSSAANACPWISRKSGGCRLKKWNTGGLGVSPFVKLLGLCSRSSCLAVPLVILLGFAPL